MFFFLFRLVENMPELELLHFDLQPKFDIIEFVEAAFKAVKLRKNNIPLDLSFHSKKKIDGKFVLKALYWKSNQKEHLIPNSRF